MTVRKCPACHQKIPTVAGKLTSYAMTALGGGLSAWAFFAVHHPWPLRAWFAFNVVVGSLYLFCAFVLGLIASTDA